MQQEYTTYSCISNRNDSQTNNVLVTALHVYQSINCKGC